MMSRCRGWCDRVWRAFVGLGSLVAIGLTAVIIYAVLLDSAPPLVELEEPGHFVDRAGRPVRSAYPGQLIYIAQKYCHESSEGGGFVQDGRGFPGLAHYKIYNKIVRSLPPRENLGKSGCWQEGYRYFPWRVPAFLEDSAGQKVTVEGWIEYWRNPVQKLLDAGVVVPMMKYTLLIEKGPSKR